MAGISECLWALIHFVPNIQEEYEKYQKKILPIAIFSYDKIHNETDRFERDFSFLKVLNFCYGIVELKKKDWRKYLNQNNPVAAVLLSKMGYSESERVKVKLEFLRMIKKITTESCEDRVLVPVLRNISEVK